jgi:pimeloyl-ACP methyl ester carboxylesterase
MRRQVAALTLGVWLVFVAAVAGATDVFELVHDRYVDNGGVRIHYVTTGHGPLVVLLHGFPDFWYGWREQIPLLSRHRTVAALDLRGYNLSDHPSGAEHYNLALLAADVAAVIRDLGYEHASIVGHDWGGAIAWFFAILYPQMTDSLVVLQTPHPRGLLRELRTNPEQLAHSAYARVLQQPDAYLRLTATGLAGWVTDPAARARYVEAFERSDFQAMLNYYVVNYPRAPYADVPLPTVGAPVLILHGLDDAFLLPAGHNSSWEWVDGPITLMTVPGVGHFIQQDASRLVTRTIDRWLRERRL